MTIGDRIHILRCAQNMTLEQLGKLVGVGKSTVRKWETGSIANMRQDKIEKLARAFGVSPLYILGQYERGEFTDQSLREPSFAASSRTVPLIGAIACGEPILALENWESRVSLPAGIDADFALRCRGDSMIQARIYDGDIVYIRQQDEVDNGQIAAVLIDDEATLKKIIYDRAQRRLILSPANDAYAPFVFVGDELDRVRILGRAVAFTSAIR